MLPKIHTLANGATIIVTSPGHGFKFSDGTMAESQHKDLCDKLAVAKHHTLVGKIKGMIVNTVKLSLENEQLDLLTDLIWMADIVLVPVMVVEALRQMGVRDKYPNLVAFNSTPETMRSPISEKIVDIDNWSY